MTKQQAGVESILAGHTPAIRDLCGALREVILGAVEGLDERAYTGGHAIGYVHPAAGLIGSIFPLEDEVHLAFEWGATLPDPAGLLVGRGKRMRYVSLRPDEAIPREAIAGLVRGAVARAR